MSTLEETFPVGPYPGLRPFTAEDASFFFGRGEQICEMLQRLEDHRFLAVVGASGSGKSSLVRAGLIPAIEQGYLLGTGSDWLTVTFRPGSSPFRNLAVALRGQLAAGAHAHQGSLDDDDVAFTEAVLRSGPKGLAEVCQDNEVPESTHLLVVADQFEEIFRFRNQIRDLANAQNIGSFSDDSAALVRLLLKSAVVQERPIYVVLTMRSDFVGDCDLFHGLPAAINDGQFLTPRLTRDQLQEAIVGPAQAMGFEIQPQLINRILNDVGTAPDHLPMMQHALLRTWLRAKDRTSSQAAEIVLTEQDYFEIGEVAGSLSLHADEVLDELVEENDQDLVRALFCCLSEREPDSRLIRRLATVQNVAEVSGCSVDRVVRIVQAFGESKRNFVIANPQRPIEAKSTLDLSHESLMRQWPKLQTWLGDEQQRVAMFHRLVDQARRWDEDERNADRLWTSANLTDAMKWQAETKPTMAWSNRYGAGLELATEFIDASQQEDTARRRRKLITAALIAVCLLAIFGTVAWAAIVTSRLNTQLTKAVKDTTAANLAVTDINNQLREANSKAVEAGQQLANASQELREKVDELKITQEDLSVAKEQLAQASRQTRQDLLKLAKSDPTLQEDLVAVIDSLNTPPRATRPLPKLEIFNRKQETRIQLRDHFDDNEDSADGLRFSFATDLATQRSLASASITNGELVIAYENNATSPLSLEIVATDRGDKKESGQLHIVFIDIQLDLNGEKKGLDHLLRLQGDTSVRGRRNGQIRSSGSIYRDVSTLYVQAPLPKDIELRKALGQPDVQSGVVAPKRVPFNNERVGQIPVKLAPNAIVFGNNIGRVDRLVAKIHQGELVVGELGFSKPKISAIAFKSRQNKNEYEWVGLDTTQNYQSLLRSITFATKSFKGKKAAGECYVQFMAYINGKRSNKATVTINPPPFVWPNLNSGRVYSN